MSDQEPNDSLWKLLGQASKVEPSPFFARNVVREARNLGATNEGIWARLRAFAGHRALFAATACALLVFAMVVVSQFGGITPAGSDLTKLSPEESSEAFDPASEMAAVEYLGQLMAVVDPGQLDDAALADLFF